MIAILTMPVAVAVNFVGGQLTTMLKLPMYLDSIGTIFGAIVGGPWVGATIGLLTHLVGGIANPVLFAFAPTSIILGILTGYLSRKGMFSKFSKSIISVLLMTFVSIVVSAPIIVYVFGGITGGGSSILIATLMAAGKNIWTSVLTSDGINNLIDRIISVLVSFAIIRVLPDRSLIKFSLGSKYITKK